MKRKNLKKAVSFMLATLMAASAMTQALAVREDPPSEAHIDSSWTMYLVPNAHIDTAWQWPYEDTARDVISDTFNRAITNLKSNENYKFTMSASKHYEWTKEYYPEMYEDVKELIANGQWDNPGGQVVEPDLNLPSGEALVRQSLEGQRFFEREFNQMSTVGYVPDTFGFNGQFPQILKKAGMDNFVTTKLNWQQQNTERDSDIFKWKAIDGTEVLAYAPMKDYVNATLSGKEGDSKLQWYQSTDGETFTPIEGATGLSYTMDKADALALAAIKFEVIPVDKDGVAGEAVSSSVVINSDSNVLVGKPVEADKQFNASEAGSMLTDGDLLTKWCADGVSEEDPRVAIIDMNGVYDLSKITLRHATAAYDEKVPGADERDRFKEYNTRKYNLYVSMDGKEWTQITAGENPDGVGVTEHIAANYITQGCVGIFGANEGSTVGTGNAIQEAGQTVIGVGFDKSDTILNLIKNGYILCTMAQNPDVMGYEGIQTAVKALEGEDVGEEFIDTGVSVINKDSL